MNLGKSAFKRQGADQIGLNNFLDRVKSGDIPNGSYLIIGNLDRLSRDEVSVAAEKFLGILNAGIRIVTLEPEMTYNRGADMVGIILAIADLNRVPGDSLRKSDLIKQAWSKKKSAAREGKLITKTVSAWLEIINGKIRNKPHAKAIVKRYQATDDSPERRDFPPALVLDDDAPTQIAIRLNAVTPGMYLVSVDASISAGTDREILPVMPPQWMIFEQCEDDYDPEFGA